MTKADPFRIVEAAFVAGAGPGAPLPASEHPEIAFAGRSNVGKSSLINALVDRKSLVRTSSSPGSTRQINMFSARAADGARFSLVDLPGYGFTRRSKAEQGEWRKLIDAYLAKRETLRALVVLADVRRGMEQEEEDLVAIVTERGIDVLVVATKIDKLSKSERKVALTAFTKASGRRAMGVSAISGEGKSELWSALRVLARTKADIQSEGTEPSNSG